MITYVYVDGFNLYYGAVKYGHFLEHAVRLPLASSLGGKTRYVQVMKTEEKGSDVNIAAHLINDGYKGLYEVAVLITNDSDLVEPVKIVRSELKLAVVVLNPHPGTPSHELRRYASFVKPIRQGVLANSQFPDRLSDATGTFHKPPRW